MRIDLNADLGESFGPYTIGHDEFIMRAISSANVACGFHAGDPSGIRTTVRIARARGVAVGAHPGFPDLAGFGRRELRATPEEVEDFVLYQIAAVAGIAAAEGLTLQHVKPHGALYNMAARERPLADAIARAVAAFDSRLILFGLPDSALLAAGRAAGLAVAREGFADRAYEPDGTLVSRRKPGALVHEPGQVLERALRMVRDGTVVAIDGSIVTLGIDTLCLHGDTAGAARLGEMLRGGLEADGIVVRAPGRADGPAD